MVGSVTPEEPPPGPRFFVRRGRAAVAAVAIGAPLLVAASWYALHRVPGLAPRVADGLRGVIGVAGVARLEELAYGVEDRFYSVWRRGEKPRAYWAVPAERPGLVAAAPPGLVPALDAGAADAAPPTAVAELPPFRPPDVGPMFSELGAPGDGQWVALPDEGAAGDPRLYKTLIHPDLERAWAELFVVAIDLRRVRLHLVAGSVEPVATAADAGVVERPGRVPDESHAGVLAAFNGGFKTEHGHYGIHAGGVTLVPPREDTCTIALLAETGVTIAPWPALEERAGDALWWRQTPECMYHEGKINWRISGGYVSRWGAALEGETVVRRSAIGIDPGRETLFVGISNHTTAPAIARGMRHAGALTVAQLDINFSYPKFLTYRQSPQTRLRVAVPLAEGFEYAEDEYLRRSSPRDFFYVMDGSKDGRTARY